MIAVSRYASTSSVTSLSSVQYSYDDFGRQLTVTDPVGTVTSNAYDFAGRAYRTYNLSQGTYTETYASGEHMAAPVAPGGMTGCQTAVA